MVKSTAGKAGLPIPSPACFPQLAAVHPLWRNDWFLQCFPSTVWTSEGCKDVPSLIRESQTLQMEKFQVETYIRLCSKTLAPQFSDSVIFTGSSRIIVRLIEGRRRLSQLKKNPGKPGLSSTTIQMSGLMKIAPLAAKQHTHSETIDGSANF